MHFLHLEVTEVLTLKSTYSKLSSDDLVTKNKESLFIEVQNMKETFAKHCLQLYVQEKCTKFISHQSSFHSFLTQVACSSSTNTKITSLKKFSAKTMQFKEHYVQTLGKRLIKELLYF